MSLEFSETALIRVFELMKRNVGALRILFNVASKKIMNPLIEDITADIIEYFHFSSSEDRGAVLFLLSKARTKGTEFVDYQSFAQLLKRPCPKAPSDKEKPFLPYLSFLDKTPSLKTSPRYQDGVKKYAPQPDVQNGGGVPQGVAAAPCHNRDTFVELKEGLERCGTQVTLPQLFRVVREVDFDVDLQKVREIFEQAANNNADVKRRDRNTADVATILSAIGPHLTMHRQKTHSSDLVKEAMAWPMHCTNSGMLVAPAGETTPRGVKPSLTCTHRSTRAVELLSSHTKVLQQDPTSPRYVGGQYHPLQSPRRIRVATKEELLNSYAAAMQKNSA